MDTLILDTNPSSEDTEIHSNLDESFVTSVGFLENPQDILSILADDSFVHSITGEDPASNFYEQDDDPASFITSGRYNEAHFYGIIIDTGASRYYIAGHKQFLALKKISDAYLDRTKAG